MRALLLGLLALTLFLTSSPPACAGEDLAAALDAMVDRRYPQPRAKAVEDLAAREDVSLDALLRAMKTFGRFEPWEAGVHVHEVPLPPVEDQERVARTVVYVPAGYDPEMPSPLLLALHGAGMRGAEMIPWWRGVADALGMLVVAPTEAGRNEGFSFSVTEREDVLEVLRWARRVWNVDENRIHLSGVSRGGHLTWDLGVRHPDRWASLSPMIGGPRLHLADGQNNLRYVENVAHLPIRDLQGRDDDARMIYNLAYAFERLKKAGAKNAQLLLQSGHGHSFDFQAVDWEAFLGESRRDPEPERVRRLAARVGEGRAYWIEILETKGKVAEEFRLKVNPRRWGALDDAGRRATMQEEADERTADLTARLRGPGRIDVKARGVKRIRLLLTNAMIGEDGRVEVSFNGRRHKKSVVRSKAVLLGEFADRFDRTFLPVADVVIP